MMKLIHNKSINISVLLSVFIVLVVFAITIISRKIQFVDDSWITFRYANNLSLSGDLTFNNNDRVEGISNLLWAFLLGAFAKIIPLQIPTIALLFSMLLICYSLYRIWKIGILLELHPLVATIPVLLVLLSPDFWGTGTNGLEMPVFTTLLLESIYHFLRCKYPLSFIFLSLLFLTRIETIGIGLLFILYMVFLRKTINKREIIVSSSVYFGVLTASTVFRIIYFHDFLPNSVRVKQVPITASLLLDGIRYLLAFLINNPVLFALFVASIFYVIHELIRLKRKKSVDWFTLPSVKLLIISLSSILFSFVVTIRNGGDWMPNFRLLFLYGALYGCLLITFLKDKIVNVIIGIALIAGPFIQVSDMALFRIRHEKELIIADYSPGMAFWGDVVDNLSPVLAPYDNLSAEAIGYIGFNLPDVSVHDPLGLTDRYIAKNGTPAIPYGKTDINYSVNIVKPSVMIWHYAGHLKNLDLKDLDNRYKVFCYENCESWSADVVMIRFDRVEDLSANFQNWEVIQLQSLP